MENAYEPAEKKPENLDTHCSGLCFWLGNWMGHTYELTEGTTTHRLAAALNLNSLLLHPFRLSADAFSLGCGIATALMAGLIYLCVKYSRHRLMPQKEYGSARWGGPEDIAPFQDENAQNNLPLTASESLSLSPKMKVTANDNYNRNKNVIVFGPSGSGKSYSVAARSYCSLTVTMCSVIRRESCFRNMAMSYSLKDTK